TLDRFVPMIVTSVILALPEAGVKELMVGGLITSKSVFLTPVPLGVTPLSFPVTPVAGTVTVICVSESTLNVVVLALPNLTIVAPVKLFPVITTDLFAKPIVGLMLVRFGSTLNMPTLWIEPARLETPILPD